MKAPDGFLWDAGVLSHVSRNYDIVSQRDMLDPYRLIINVYRRGEPVLNRAGFTRRFASRAHAVRHVRHLISKEIEHG